MALSVLPVLTASKAAALRVTKSTIFGSPGTKCRQHLRGEMTMILRMFRVGLSSTGPRCCRLPGRRALFVMNLAAMGEAAAATASDYKALVCVFLYGGNDYANTLVPTTMPPTRPMPRKAPG